MTGTELALVITAASAGIVNLLGGIGAFIMLFRRVKAVHDLTNSLADKAQTGAKAEGNLEGRKEQTAERKAERTE